MDNGKENRFFTMKNGNIFAQGKKGGISPPFERFRDRGKIHKPQIPFDVKRAVDGDNALNCMSAAVKNVDHESSTIFSRMGFREMYNSKLSRGSKANEQNHVHVGNGIAGREMASLSQMKKRKEEEEEEEEEAHSSSCATSYASTLSGEWPTDDEGDCVQSEFPKKKGFGKWFPSLFPLTTWMDQLPRSSPQEAGLSIDSPLSYESHGTGEEDEVVEGEVSNIDAEDDEAEHLDVSTDSGQESGEEKELASQPSVKKRKLEELKRSLEERERKVDSQIKELLNKWSAHRTFTVKKKDKILSIFWDGGKKQWLVSDGVRCRKHNKVWDPQIRTDSPTTVPEESGAAEEEDEVGEAINIDAEDDEVEEEDEEEEDMGSDDDMRKLEALISGTREIIVRVRSLGNRKEDESGSRTVGVLEERARKAESSKRKPGGFGSLFTTRA